MQDSLLGKVNEKLGRTLHVLEKKDEENLRGKQQMKELISDISHQTRTPVANQKIYLEILKDMDLPGEGNGIPEQAGTSDRPAGFPVSESGKNVPAGDGGDPDPQRKRRPV